jgi:hypothetical protein
MSSIDIIGAVSIITAGITIAIGSIGPALGEGMALARQIRLPEHCLSGWRWLNRRLSIVWLFQSFLFLPILSGIMF